MAYSHSRFRHRDGCEINVWSEVEEDASDYTVSDDHDYAVEITDEDGEYVEGESFVTEKTAKRAVVKAMQKHP